MKNKKIIQKINKTKISKGGIAIFSLTMRDKKDLVKILETITFPSFKDSLISFESSLYFMSFRLKNG